MDARIILAGQPTDIVGNVDRGFQAGRRNALAALYREHGPGIMSGDPNAMNALAAFDAPTAMGIQDQRQAMDARALGMDNTRLNMQATRQRMRILDEQQAQAVAERARAMTEAERLQAAEQVKRGIKAGSVAQTPQEWDRIVTQFGAEDLVGQFANRGALLRQYMDIADILEMDAPPKPMSSQGKFEHDKGLGLVPPDAEYKPGGTTNVETKVFNAPDPVAGDSVGDVYNPGEVNDTIRLIDEIYQDPALAKVTGPVEGGGGNDVDQMNMAQRMWYGEDGLGLIQKVNQLQSRSWLSARAMLKGGGPITDYESRKAEAAVARLQRAQGTEEYKAALKDLRDAITTGMAKLEQARRGQGVVEQGDQTYANPGGDLSQMTDEELDAFIREMSQ